MLTRFQTGIGQLLILVTQILLLVAGLLDIAACKLVMFDSLTVAAIYLGEFLQAVAVTGQGINHPQLIRGRDKQEVLVLGMNVNKLQGNLLKHGHSDRCVIDKRPRTTSGGNLPSEDDML